MQTYADAQNALVRAFIRWFHWKRLNWMCVAEAGVNIASVQIYTLNGLFSFYLFTLCEWIVCKKEIFAITHGPEGAVCCRSSFAQELFVVLTPDYNPRSWVPSRHASGIILFQCLLKPHCEFNLQVQTQSPGLSKTRNESCFL